MFLKSLEPQPRLHSQDIPSPYLTLTFSPEWPKGSRSHCLVSWVLHVGNRLGIWEVLELVSALQVVLSSNAPPQRSPF